MTRKGNSLKVMNVGQAPSLFFLAKRIGLLAPFFHAYRRWTSEFYQSR
jgi:hypothetical protein